MSQISHYPAAPFGDWDGSPAAARAMQLTLAAQVRLQDDFPTLRLIAGVDVGFEDGGTVTRAAAVLLDADTLELVGSSLARIPTNMPYVPGLLSFRELPAVLQALAELPAIPDLIFSDGHGIAHPRRLGIAAHLGVVTGLPTIGVAKKLLTGEHEELDLQRGARVALRDKKTGEVIGCVLRSKDKVRPLIISPGNRVSIATAPRSGKSGTHQAILAPDAALAAGVMQALACSPAFSMGLPTMHLDSATGWCHGVRHCPSPNFNQRPAGEISLLVIHNISLPPGQFGTGRVQQFFQNCLQCDEHPFFEEIAGLQVSAHFLIERDGAIIQFVSCLDRAWHAGVSCFDGREGCNDFSIGIELEGTDHEPFSEAQYQTLIELCRLLQCAYPAITPERVCGHSDIAPGRKTDPGPAFDWLRLRAASITC